MIRYCEHFHQNLRLMETAAEELKVDNADIGSKGYE